MNCVIVGGGGFIGSHLAEALLNQNNNVTIFDRPGAAYLELLSQKGAVIELGSFSETNDLNRILFGTDILFHLASTTVPKTSIDDPVFDIKTNLIGTINLLNVARDVGIKKLVFSSSGGTVYGIPRVIPITEEHPTNPISSYGITKLAIEKYLALFWTLYGLDYCILRVSNAYGERQVVSGTQGVIPTLITNALNHHEIRIWGDGSVIRDYIHVSDIISAFMAAALHKGEPKVFNIGSGIGHSINDIVKTLEELMDESLNLVYETGRPFDVPVNILDTSLARQALKWEAKVNLEAGVRQTLAFMKDDT